MEVQQLVPEMITLDLSELKSEPNFLHELSTFSSLSIDFANEFSKSILRNKTINRIPAYVALAYWLRKANLTRIVKENQFYQNNQNISIGPLGKVLHICPSNVDTMFLYSLFLSLLTGNMNIVRISSRTADKSLNELFAILNSLFAIDIFRSLRDYIKVISYTRDTSINEYLSSLVNGRVIWGGDETVKTFRNININPRSKDIVFSDRLSIALFRVKHFLQLDESEKLVLANSFFNDAYTFDQKACSSPQLIILLGSESSIKTFKTQFYSLLNSIVSKNYVYDKMSLASLKFNQLAIDAIEGEINSYYGPDTNLVLAELDSKSNIKSCGGGYFYTKSISDIQEIENYTNKNVQTITYSGLDEDDISEIVKLSNGKGIDRVVPIGSGLSFDYIWDGYNLIEELTSKKYVLSN
jgi:hypothetical protein